MDPTTPRERLCSSSTPETVASSASARPPRRYGSRAVRRIRRMPYAFHPRPSRLEGRASGAVEPPSPVYRDRRCLIAAKAVEVRGQRIAGAPPVIYELDSDFDSLARDVGRAQLSRVLQRRRGCPVRGRNGISPRLGYIVALRLPSFCPP